MQFASSGISCQYFEIDVFCEAIRIARVGRNYEIDERFEPFRGSINLLREMERTSAPDGVGVSCRVDRFQF